MFAILFGVKIDLGTLTPTVVWSLHRKAMPNNIYTTQYNGHKHLLRFVDCSSSSHIQLPKTKITVKKSLK